MFVFFPRFQKARDFSIHASSLLKGTETSISHIRVKINEFFSIFYTKLRELFLDSHTIRHEHPDSPILPHFCCGSARQPLPHLFVLRGNMPKMAARYVAQFQDFRGSFRFSDLQIRTLVLEWRCFERNTFRRYLFWHVNSRRWTATPPPPMSATPLRK